MPNINQIEVNNITYDLEDTQARQTIEDGLAQVTADMEENLRLMQSNIAKAVFDWFIEGDSLYLLDAAGEIINGPITGIGGSGGGGGGGSSETVTTIELHNSMPWLATTIRYGAKLPITFNWSSTLDDIPTGVGVLSISNNGSFRATLNIDQGSVTVDVGSYLSPGVNNVTLKVSDAYGMNRKLTYTITAQQISLSSTFDAASAYSSPFNFPYTPVGSVPKTVHFKLDDVEQATVDTTLNNRQLTYPIPALSHGGHSLEVWFIATINGEEVESNHLYYEFIYLDPEDTSPIIVSPFNEDLVSQYDTVHIPFTVYTSNSITSEVQVFINGTLTSEITVDRTEYDFSYRADEAGPVNVAITSGNVTKTIRFTVTELDIDAAAETEGLQLYLTSTGRSNAEANPNTWTYNDVEATFSNFNWKSDGWQNDDVGITALRVAGDARVTIPYKIFENDFRTGGRTIEVEFATRDVRDYDAEILSCYTNGRGFALTSQTALLASEQTAISTQFKENEHVRVSFVIQKKSEQRLILCYINGIPSGVVQYPDNDDFSQVSPVNISIGGTGATVDIYNIRIYDHDLTRYQVLNNWIADTQVGYLMVERYNHNNVYDEYGNIVIAQLPTDLPYLILEGALPTYKGNKLIISGSYTDPLHPEKSFTFEDAQIDVQGTSSQYYARKNYKIKFNGGFTINGVTTNKYAMNDDAIPTKTFTMKADVASSEGANNVELVRLYNDICPYKTSYQKANSKVRQGIDGFPIVIFHNNGLETYFLGKYNWNNDKGTEEVYGFSEGDESWEIRNNTSNRVLWKSDDYESMGVDDKGNPIKDFLNDFEARYPEDNVDATNLKALATWLKSTDQTQTTGDDLAESVSYTDTVAGESVTTTYTKDTAEYRLSKFKHELTDYVELDAILFYYLFTELFLMVDSRAKNAFPTKMGGSKWFILPYDFDTALGINNEGALVFSYNLEDIDHTSSGADIFNGQNSVLWVNLRQAFYSELTSMYQSLRSGGKLSYPIVEKMFEDHQKKWPEAVFIEDAQFKYLDPLIYDGDGSYLNMLQGSKEEQRKWWLYNRFRYIDSKYNAGDALTDVIQLRGYANANITVTPYADIYPAVKYGSYLVMQRGQRGVATTLVNPLDNTNDTEIYIYSCSQLSSIGDISGLKVGFADFSNATKLQHLKIGDSSDSYENGNLEELYLGNNRLLQTLDVRNCSSLTQSVDLRGCVNIEEVYFDGTAITGVQLPNGGVLNTLHLPETITNLTIQNQTSLTDLVAPVTNLTTLRIENVPNVDTKALVNSLSASTRVRLVGFTWECADAAEIRTLYNKLDTMRGLDENNNNMEQAQLSGVIHTNSLSGDEISELSARYPYITLTADHTTTYLKYYNFEGTTLLNTESILDGGDGTYTGTPSHESTAANTYTFIGWSTSPNSTVANANATKNVTSNRNVYAAYQLTGRTYTVTFARASEDGGGTLQTVQNVAYGGSASYTGSTPTTTKGSATDYPFQGWSPSPTNITGNTTCYAQFGSPLEVAEITDSWETIFANIDNGTYTSKYKVGNYKSIDLGTEGSIQMQIVAKDADPKANGDGNAPLTMIGVQLLNTNHRMNPSKTANTEGTGALGGWDKCEMKTYLTTTILPLIPAVVRERIVPVTKYTNIFRASDETKVVDVATTETVWIPSNREIFGGTNYETQGPIYNVAFKDAETRKKYKVDASSATYWWLRSAYSATHFRCVTTNGYDSTSVADFSYGVALGFSLGSFNDVHGITDSWADILAAEQDGTYSTKYHVGDVKQLDLGTEGIVNMQIAAMDTDELADGSGNAKITWISKELLATSHRMNPSKVANTEGTGTLGGWEKTEMRTYLTDTIKPKIPDVVRNALKTVKKYSTIYQASDETKVNNVVTEDDVWIPSNREIFGGTSYETSGPIYSGLFTDTNSRKKYKSGNSSATDWWLRSANSATYFRCVNDYGSNNSGNADDSHGVALGFST